MKTELRNVESERDSALKKFEENKGFTLHDFVKRGNIIEHIIYTLKNKPKLDKFNWDKEHTPYVERLEKIARGEMTK